MARGSVRGGGTRREMVAGKTAFHSTKNSTFDPAETAARLVRLCISWRLAFALSVLVPPPPSRILSLTVWRTPIPTPPPRFVGSPSHRFDWRHSANEVVAGGRLFSE